MPVTPTHGPGTPTHGPGTPTHGPGDLGALIERAGADLAIPGGAVGVIENDGSETSCFGVTNVDHPLPVTDTTIFQIGSISKTFVATTAMVLVDRGELDLDEPIRSYVPNLKLSTHELTSSVTMRHLMTHSTGWVGDYFADTGQGDEALALFVAKLAKAPQLTPLGSVYSYNNSAFNLAAHVVALVKGSSFERAVKDLVLRPLGMSRTFYKTDEAISHRIAVGHRNGVAQPWRRLRAHNGAGGVLSCVADMLAYAKYHLGDGSPLMSPTTFELMQHDASPAGSLCDEVGIAWMIDTYGGKKMVHHGGTTNGYQADLRMVPSRRLAWVMLTNSDHHHQLDRAIREHLVGHDTRPSAFAPHDLQEFCGRYEAALADLDVSVDADRLILKVATPRRAMWNPEEEPDAPLPTALFFRGEDRVEALDMPFTAQRGEFIRGEAGLIEWFRWDGRIARRQPS